MVCLELLLCGISHPLVLFSFFTDWVTLEFRGLTKSRFPHQRNVLVLETKLLDSLSYFQQEEFCVSLLKSLFQNDLGFFRSCFARSRY